MFGGAAVCIVKAQGGHGNVAVITDAIMALTRNS
jgi:hypothetical protein